LEENPIFVSSIPSVVRRSVRVKLSDYSDAWARKEFTEKPPLPGSGMWELGLVCQE